MEPAVSVELIQREQRGRASTDPSPGDALPGPPSPEFLALIPCDFARRHLILSAGFDGGTERLLVSDRSDPAAVFNCGVRLGRQPRTLPADAEAIARAIDAAYAAARPAPDIAPNVAGPLSDGDIDRLLAEADRDLLATSGKGPVVRLVDAILFEALGRAASDVHVQPLADRTLVKYRVDGVLHTARELPARLTSAVVSRIKVMGRMDIAERRVAQDGRATVRIGDRAIDLRLSTFPTSYGERVVVRLLEASGPRLSSFEALGMPGPIQALYLDRANRANGIVLLTGPTGSGKTTTLYTTLKWLAEVNRGELNIMTVEDPIEYELALAGVEISQGQVNAKKGVTFASGLRHILRQDPDAIMVGEIRDAETARIAIQASLTGHLVFSTLHTNDAASAVTRLVDLGVEPYLVGASLSAVLAQRLVRRVHAGCDGRGCAACFGAGLLGRIGVFELLAVDDGLRDLVARAEPAAAIRAAARAGGMRTLEEEGERLIAGGLTTREEVVRVVQGVV